jgi:Tol biopolymer transport system component/DNA-binding winged helix-turn-helix (wHTH) protein
MASASPSADLVRFGIFELDRRSGELRKAGARVSLQEQGLQVLMLLLERPGDLVTRDELRQRLWPTGTFGDFDHGLNAVINRLRDALGDSAEAPRFIETLPRRGYRFVAPIAPDLRASPAVAPEATSVPQQPSGRPFLRRPAGRTAVAVLALGLVAVVTAALWQLRRPLVLEGPPPTVVSITSLVGNEDWPAFSPDGEQVAFASSGEKSDNWDIYVALIGAPEIRRLTTDPAVDAVPRWSPDGRHIAFLRIVGQTLRIHITSPLGGPDLKVNDFPVTSGVSWSPDSRFIVAGLDEQSAAGAPAGIYVIPLDGGERRAVTQPAHPNYDNWPAFSPDGHHLAYVSCHPHCDVRVVDVDNNFAATSEARTLTRTSLAVIGSLTWSRDGRSVLFDQMPGDSGIWRVSVQGDGDLARVELAGLAQHPATVGSRDRLAFARPGGSAHLYQFNAALPDETIAESSSSEVDPHFSPDGRRLAFSSGRSGRAEIWVAAADGSNVQQLTHGTVSGGSPSWAPDGHTIAFDGSDAPGAQYHIWTIDADGGAIRQVTQGADDQMAPTWSGDGQWIYFSAGTRQGRGLDIWRVPVAGGRPEQVTRGGSGFLGIESFDGAGLLYQAKHEEDSALLLQPLSGGKTRTVVDCVRFDAFATAGRVVFYAACESGWNSSLHAIDMVTGQDRILGRLEHFSHMPHISLAVSPDGKTVLYTAAGQAERDLMMIENFR